MKQEELYHKLVDISDVDDFVLELKPTHSKCYWGRYFPARKLIRLYALNENGEFYDDSILIKEGLHELTHHIQYTHIPFWERKPGVMHDTMFWEIFRGMLSKAFNHTFMEVVNDEQAEVYFRSMGTENNQSGESWH